MKKKTIIITSILASLVIMTVVAIYLIDVMKIKDNTYYMNAEYEYYSSVEDLVEEVDFVYEGKITGYHFEVIDLRDGTKFKKKEERDTYCGTLCTVYDVEIIKQYKGIAVEKATIKIEGGILGDRDFEQAMAIKNAGLTERPIAGRVMEVGETYLLLVCGNEGSVVRGSATSHFIPNPGQYKYNTDELWGTASINYDNLLEYLNSEAFVSPKEVPTVLLEDDSPQYATPKEIVENSTRIFEGYIRNIKYIVNDSQLYTMYVIQATDKYSPHYSRLCVVGGNNEYDIKEQCRVLNNNRISTRPMYKNCATLEIGKTYLFVANVDRVVLNPAQFAFATDDSNAPGGVTYSMIKEYLKNK